MARLCSLRSVAHTAVLSLLVRTISAQTCTGVPTPGLPSTCGALTGNIGTYTDACGSNYTIFCGYNSNPGAVGNPAQVSTLQACMQACDAYSGCVQATFTGTNCFFKTSLQSLFVGNNIATVIKYAPNPAYPPPVPAAGYVNASSGCGSALPASLSPYGSSMPFSFINPTDGANRTFRIKIPQYYSSTAASPLILAFPGHGSDANGIEGLTGLSGSTYNSYGVVVYVDTYPYGQGFESNPDYAAGGPYANVDDIGFVKNLIANMTASFCIDTGAIMATGHSNGAGLVNVLACDPVTSVTIAVFAPNSAAIYSQIKSSTNPNPFTMEPLGTPVQANCLPGRNNVPMLEFHGTNDSTINYYGSINHAAYAIPAIPHWVTDWSVRLGYGTASIQTNIPTTATWSTGVTMFQFGGSSGSLGIVTHYQLGNWTHNWPNSGTDSTAPVNAAVIAMNYMYTFTNYSRVPVFNPANSTVGVLPSATPVTTTTTTTTATTNSSTSTSPGSSSTSSYGCPSVVYKTTTLSPATVTMTATR